jgi:hypothetical protein
MEGRGGDASVRFGPAGPERWPDVRHLLVPAIRWAGEKREAEVVAELAGGMAQLWIGEDDAVRCGVVTCLSRTTRGLVCEIWLMGGRERGRWLHFIEHIEDCARRRGCRSVELTGRNGWRRVLPGYRQKAVVLERIL